MSNYYQQITAVDSIECCEADFERLQSALNDDVAERLRELEGDHGFEFSYEPTGAKSYRRGFLYIYAPDFGNVDIIPEAALGVIGEIIAAAGMEYLEFGAASYCDKCCPDSAGGFRFRIHKTGYVEYAKTVWEGEQK